MTEYDLIAEGLKKQIMDLTYFEKVQQWSKIDYRETISNLCVAITRTCEIMTQIGPDKFWVHEKGITGWNGTMVDVRKRFGLFGNLKNE